MKKVFSCFLVLASLPLVAGCGCDCNRSHNNQPVIQNQTPAQGTITKALTKNDLRSALATSKPVVIKFSAQWCGPCRQMQPIFEELSKELSGKYAFVEIDIDAAEGIISDYSISGVPTFIIIKDGKEVRRQSGSLSKDTLRNFIQK